MTFFGRDTVAHLRAILLQRGVGPEDADDLVQEAFQRLENYRQSHVVRKPKGFLVRTVVNLHIDKLRQQRRASIVPESIETLSIEDRAPLPEQVYASKRQLEHLNKGFAELNPLTRRILLEQRLEGLSVEQIAKRNGLSVSAVEKRIAKGMLFLVEWMSEW